MNVTDKERKSYFDHRRKLLDLKDPCAAEFFLSEDHLFNKYKSARKDYFESLKAKSKSPSDIDILKAHQESPKVAPHEIIPRKQTLSKALTLDQLYCKSWIQPEDHPTFILNTVINHQIPILNFNQEKFENNRTQFESALRAQKNFIFHATPLPFSVEFVKVPRKIYNQIFKNKRSTQRFLFKTTVDCEDAVTIPTRFTIGGSSHALSFTFGLSEQDNSDLNTNELQFAFTYSEIPQIIQEFWKTLPSIYCENAKSKINELNNFFNDLYDINIKFYAFDVGALAVVSGCKLDSYDLHTLSVITTGIAFPVGIELMDNRWAASWEFLPKACQIYLGVKLYRLNTIFNILMGHIIRNIFPDPDVVLEVTEMTQQSFTAYFTEFVGYSLSKADMSKPVNPDHSRRQLVKNLGPDYLPILDLANLIMNVPVVSCGGARYLHNSRLNFKNQYEVLKNIPLNMYPGEPPNCHKNLDKLIRNILYLRPVESSTDGSDLPSKGLGLLASPAFQSTLYKIDLDYDDVCVLKPQYDCPIEPAVLEWARLNVSEIPLLFRKMRDLKDEDLSHFWLDKACLYEDLKAIYFNVVGIKISVPKIEESLIIRKENVQGRLDETTSKRIMQNQILRANLLKHKSQRMGFAKRAAIHQQVYGAIPGDFKQKNKDIEMIRKEKRDRMKEIKGDKWLTKRELKKQKRLIQSREGKVSDPRLQTSRNYLSPDQSAVKSFQGYRSNSFKNNISSTDLRHRCNETHSYPTNSLPRGDLRNRLH